MLIKLWVAVVAIDLCPCALSLLFFLSSVDFSSSFLSAEKPLQEQLRSISCARRQKSMAASSWILLFSTPSFVYFLLYHGKCKQSFKITGSSLLKKIRCNITRILCCVSFNMILTTDPSWNNNILCKRLFKKKIIIRDACFLVSKCILKAYLVWKVSN